MSDLLSELDLSPTAFGDSCTVRPGGYLGSPDRLCGHDAVITAVAGCVHEHLLRRPACQFHVERLVNGRVECGRCWRADGHSCEMHLLREIPTP